MNTFNTQYTGHLKSTSSVTNKLVHSSMHDSIEIKKKRKF